MEDEVRLHWDLRLRWDGVKISKDEMILSFILKCNEIKD